MKKSILPLVLFSILMVCMLVDAAGHKPRRKTYEAKHRATHAKGLKKKKHAWKKEGFRHLNVPIPTTFDLRPELSPIMDQGQCGDCWSFSLTATLQDGLKSEPLSQQYLTNCAKNAAGCNGGYFDAADYLVTPLGPALLKDLPYKGYASKCVSQPTAASILDWHMIGSNDGPSAQDIEAYMVTAHKEISITVAAGAGDWQSYSGGVYNGCEMGQTDHMINIVGWDNEGQTFDAHGNLPHGKGVWILRNSWSPQWGEAGWMRTKMTDENGNRCNNVAEEAAYFDFPAVETPAPTPSPVPSPSNWSLVLGGAFIAIASVIAAILKKV